VRDSHLRKVLLMTPTDPQEILAQRALSPFQLGAIGLCVGLNALDGFDVLSISFASPLIAKQWGVDRAALGVVLSMELIGMSIGSVILGGLADARGRRPTILACLMVMTTGMLLASAAHDVATLSIYRLFTGIGIGGMLASINAMVAEYANDRRRSLAVAIMAAGYPIGAVIGGTISSRLLSGGSWQVIFLLGGLATAAAIPLTWFFLPESIDYLTQKRPLGALERINATLVRMGHPTVVNLPPPGVARSKTSTAELFSAALLRTTSLLTLAYFAHIMTFYFTLKWIPKIVVDMGFAPSAAGGVLVWASMGGAAGALSVGLLTQRFSVRSLVLGGLVLSACMVFIFGRGQASLGQLALAAAAAGFFTNSAVVGLYALFAQVFPTSARAGGTGFVIGIGRGGAALGPIVAGLLFASGAGLGIVATLMALGSVLAACAILALPRPESTAETDRVGVSQEEIGS
jgi:benzoate transport